MTAGPGGPETSTSSGADRIALGCVIVVLGATGDLALRKLYPALSALAARGLLPRHLALVGISRTSLDGPGFEKLVAQALADAGVPDGHREAFGARAIDYRYVSGSFADPATFARLRDVVDAWDAREARPSNRLFYLATIPPLFPVAAEGLGAAGLTAEPPGGFCRLVIEKPFGHDRASAAALNRALHTVVPEDRIFRIDHYLAKETVQNILALRFANAVFEPLWNRRYVHHVEVTVAETLGIGHRANFYESAGALRDIVQNHMLQVLALTMMEPPASFAPESVRDEKVKVLRAVRPWTAEDAATRVVRGQYVAARVDEHDVPGYRDEEGVAPDSRTETYVALAWEIDNWRWAGVPILVRTGKRLAARVTEVSLHYRPVPHLPLPAGAVDSMEPNTMVIRIQPDEGIALSFGVKEPGSAFRVRTVPLEFSYADAFAEPAPDAYERVLLDALRGDPTLFIREDEVDESWRIVEPVADAFARDALPLCLYPAGGWGPTEADDLSRRYDGENWRAPSL